MTSGKIGVTTENIFPVIKKFLYSDHEIFLRELVSNAVDASQKLKTLAAFGDFKGELGTLDVRVKIDKEAGTLTVSDHGIGMDAEDIDKYINQIAFSGAEDFLAKYKDNANNIIGHFGLGFYSAFMVADKVEIHSLSYKEGAKAVRWSCDGSPEYSLEPAEKAERGTDIILHIAEDSKEFLEQERIDTLLKKYCRFMPVPVISGKEQEWKDGKMVDTDRDKIINATEPLWTRKPADLTDEDYLKFYHELMPGQEDPMFWIHLNVDFPFSLTGILYFPKIRSNFDVQRNRILLYCNQVYVTDQVEGVVPEFMTLMQGVIDSPDIPLNVSRSYLQADSRVKKISSYISKKVAEKLSDMFKEDRQAYEHKWDDIKVFIQYGMLTDDKFCEQALKFALLKDIDGKSATDGKYYTLEEYRKLVEPAQTDKNGDVIYLYATDPAQQYGYIQSAQDRGYSVLLMDGQLDPHFVTLLEQKETKTRLLRVDADVIDKLIQKEDKTDAALTPLQVEVLTPLFNRAIPQDDKMGFIVQFQAMSATDMPATVVQNEFMRRMHDMAKIQGNNPFMADMPQSYNLVVNTNQPAVAKVVADATAALKDTVQPLLDKIDAINAEVTELKKDDKDEAKKAEADTKLKETGKLRAEIDEAVKGYTAGDKLIGQIADLALLRSGLLQGPALDTFVRRSVDLLK